MAVKKRKGILHQPVFICCFRQYRIFTHIILSNFSTFKIAVANMTSVIKHFFVDYFRKEIEGPAMLINGSVFRWCCNGSDLDCDCNSKVIKEFFVPINGEGSGKVSRGFAKLVNTGTTIIRYSWKVKHYLFLCGSFLCIVYMGGTYLFLAIHTCLSHILYFAYHLMLSLICILTDCKGVIFMLSERKSI